MWGGNGVTILDITEAKSFESKYPLYKNVKGHYLTEGDVFDFKTKTLISSKA